MSRKSVPFSVSAGARRPAPDVVIEAHTDDWVSDRHAPGDRATPAPGPSLVLDLAAERGLMEVVALAMLAPMALGFFWFLNVMAGRVRL